MSHGEDCRLVRVVPGSVIDGGSTTAYAKCLRCVTINYLCIKLVLHASMWAFSIPLTLIRPNLAVVISHRHNFAHLFFFSLLGRKQANNTTHSVGQAAYTGGLADGGMPLLLSDIALSSLLKR